MTNTDPYKQSMKIILSQLTQYISTYRQSQLQKQCIFTSLQQKQNKTNIKQQDRINIQKQLRIFYDVLLNVGNQWIDLLINDGIQSETLIIKINNGVTLTKIYQNMVQKVDAQINKQCYQITANKDNKNNQINFQQIFMTKTCKNMLTQILNNISKTIVQGYKYGKNTIIHYIKKIQKQIQKKQMMNPYIAFSLLKQVSVKVQKQIIQYLNKTIINIQSAKSMEFCKYIQKNYQLLILDYGDTNYIYSKEELRLYTKEENDRWLQYIRNYVENNIQVQHIQSLNGDTGILVSKKIIKQYQQTMDQMNNTQQQISNNKDKKNNKKDKDKDDQKLILKIQNGKQIKVLNAKICQNSWKIFQTKKDINQIYQVLRKQIQSSDSLKVKQYVSIGIPTCQYATIGGSLGKCLADIDKYNDANQFFLDLSKSAAISTTFSIAMTEIPILSYFIIAGGLSYSYYLACSNHATSSIRKANEVGSATFIAVGSIGSTVGGILLGQAVIPVPFLGAFVGGLIGGFIGTKTVTTINSLLQHSNFRDIIVYMKSKIILQRYWKCTKYMLQRIGLDQKYFYKHTPPGQRNKDIYITAICFCIVTFYQSRRKKQFTQQKLKQYKEEEQKKEQKKEQNQKKSIFNIFNTKKDQTKEYQQKTQYKIQQKQTKEQNETKIGKQIKEQLFHNQFNIVKIIQFLTEQNFMILDHLDHLQNFICHIV